MNRREVMRASGYLLVLAPPMLLVVGIWQRVPLAAAVGLFIVSPLLRVLFGDAPPRAPRWTEAASTALHALPLIFAVVFVGSMWIVLELARGTMRTAGEIVGLGVSLWTTFVFATCPIHELLHRRDSVSRAVGRVLAGMIGYPVFEHEHRAHHLRPGDVEHAEWPRKNESV
jgi:hypothetical protein